MRYALMLLASGFLLLSSGCAAQTPTLEARQKARSLLILPTINATASRTAPPSTPTASTAAQISSKTPLPRPTATATPTAVRATTTPAPPTVTFSADGRHAFPVAGNVALMTWTHFHWDGGHAVDIEAARELAGDSDAFNTFIQLPVVAVVTGTVAIADNKYGGLALLLDGDDGYRYYYGHLSEQWVDDGEVVQPGDWLGQIGNSGFNTQYIEPHLHFSIATQRADDWRWEPDVNAAEQLLTWFDLPWRDLRIPDYPADHVAGWPLRVPAQITRDFSEPLAQNPDQGSIHIVPTGESRAPVPVYATVGGEVNVNRATVMGLRAQITNRPARTTVVYSYLLKTNIADGDVVKRGDLVGYIDPTLGLNYMLFVNDKPTDPVPTMGDPTSK